MKGTELVKGQEIGYLKLVEPTAQRERGYVVWKCSCVCGNIVYISSKTLKRKTVISCGCVYTRGKRNQNLVGKKCGLLTVDRLWEKKDTEGKRLWHLSCECGGETLMNTADVNREKKRHCGCQNLNNRVSLYGYQSGDLTAIRPTEKRSKQGSVIWECACKCGTVVEVSENDLVHGSRVSCGCRKRAAQENIAYKLHRFDETCIERLGQKPARKDNKSGVCGVQLTNTGRYRAYIGFKKKKYSLGTYSTLQEAEQVRIKAVEELHMPLIKQFQEK